jgi:hypothetical protein
MEVRTAFAVGAVIPMTNGLASGSIPFVSPLGERGALTVNPTRIAKPSIPVGEDDAGMNVFDCPTTLMKNLGAADTVTTDVVVAL